LAKTIETAQLIWNITTSKDSRTAIKVSRQSVNIIRI